MDVGVVWRGSLCGVSCGRGSGVWMLVWVRRRAERGL